MLRKRRWQMIVLLFLAGVINYMDRSALSVAAPLITKDLGLEPAQLGIVFSAFFIGYAVFNFIGGYCSDKFGPHRVFSAAMAVWSLFCGVTALATGYASMLVIRVCFGVGEGPLSSTMNKSVRNWFPHREQASAMGIASSGTPLGGAIAGPVVGLLALQFGWRVSFVAIAIVGFVWLVFWQLMFSDRPDTDPRVSPDERREIEQGRLDENSQGPARPLRAYLVQPTILATALAFFGYNYILFFFLSWFPSYLMSEQHLSLQNMSIVTVIPWTLGFVGLALGGWLSDLVFRRTGNALGARKLVLIACLALAGICVGFAGFVTTVESAVALMAAAVFFLYLTGSTYWAILQDTVRGENVGGVGGFIHAVANCAGIIGPAATGFIKQWTNSFESAFYLAGGIALIGVLAVALFVKPLRAEPGETLIEMPAR
jgi:MFS transporter, ACS family, hexuronate transporter